MKRMLALSGIVAAAVLVAAAQAAQQTPDMGPIGQIQKVRNNLYMIPGQGGNTAVFVTRAGVILVDTKVTNNGQAILDRVAAVADVPVTMIVNTHSHFDHVGSNEFFSPTVEVVTHENTRANMAKDPAVKDKPQAMPDRTFRDRLTIGRGQEQVDLYHFGPAHTSGDAFVVFPALRTMHTGDVFAWKAAPFVDLDNGGSAVALPDTLEKAIRGVPNIDTVIPGHMDVTTWSAFVEFAEFNRELLRAAQAARKAGRTMQQAAAELKLPSKFDAYLTETPIPGLELLGTYASRARLNVEAIYRELDRR
jgi:glyoxylase-like metal-dependent hydrolase (beta-lactamase superfamily II)